jgi:hypothetical protein
MKRPAFILLLFFVVVTARCAGIIPGDSIMVPGGAQPGDSALSTVSIRCSIEHALVILDTTVIGTAPIIHYPVTAGKHIISVQQVESWNCFSPAIVETIAVGCSEHIERTILFPPTYEIRSDPFGADVYYKDSLLGKTPLQISSPVSGTFRLSKEGYRTFSLAIPTEDNKLNAVLEPIVNTNQNGSLFLRQTVKTPPSFYVAAGGAVLSGAAAVYFKISADKLYREYQRTGDGITLCHVKRLDVAAGISLVLSEISIFMLYSLLLSE